MLKRYVFPKLVLPLMLAVQLIGAISCFPFLYTYHQLWKVYGGALYVYDGEFYMDPYYGAGFFENPLLYEDHSVITMPFPLEDFTGRQREGQTLPESARVELSIIGPVFSGDDSATLQVSVIPEHRTAITGAGGWRLEKKILGRWYLLYGWESTTFVAHEVAGTKQSTFVFTREPTRSVGIEYPNGFRIDKGHYRLGKEYSIGNVDYYYTTEFFVW